jgi:hypothetical protein
MASLLRHYGVMDLAPFADGLRREFLAAAQARGDNAREVAEQLVGALDAATRLTLLEALTTAADEITGELAPGSVEVRLRGMTPGFVVTMAPSEHPVAPPVHEDGPAARINFRPPESLKNRIDAAAARDGLSVNAWLVRVVAGALADGTPAPQRPAGNGDQHHVGWVH